MKQHSTFDDNGNEIAYWETDAEGNVVYQEAYTYFPDNKIKNIYKSTGEEIGYDKDGEVIYHFNPPNAVNYRFYIDKSK